MGSFGNPPQDISDIYIIFVMSMFDTYQIDYSSLVDPILKKYENSKETDDSYVMSFVGLLYENLGEKLKADTIAQQLIANQNSTTGEFEKAKSTITLSRGKSKSLETSAVALLLLMRNDFTKFNKQIEKGVNYLLTNMQDGYFASTQATILCLKAIVKYSQLLSTKGKGVKTFETIINNFKREYSFEITNGKDEEFEVLSFDELKNTQETSLNVRFEPKFSLEEGEKYVFSVNYK